MYFNIGGGSKLPGSNIDPTVNRLARYNMSGEDGDTKEDIVIHVHILRTIELKLKVQLVISNNSDAIKHDINIFKLIKYLVLSSFSRFVTRVTWQVPLVEQVLLTLQEHLSSPLVFCGVHV